MRIRSVKPEFWTDRKTTGRWPADMRLVYSALWCYADDAGRFELELVPLKAALFPYGCKLTEGGPELDFEAVLERLIACDRLAIYSVDGFLFGFLPKMGAHQHPNRPTPSKFPEYSEALRVQWRASSRSNPDSLTEGSVRTHGGLTPVVGEGEGEGEGVGERTSSQPSVDEPVVEAFLEADHTEAKFAFASQSPAVAVFPCRGGKSRTITEAEVARWSESRPGVDVRAEVLKARDWLEATPAKRKTVGGCAKFMVGWLNRNQERIPPPPPQSIPWDGEIDPYSPEAQS